MRICPHCKIEFIGKGTQFGAHIRNCKLNPKREEINKKNSNSHKIERKKYTLYCKSCKNEYEVILTEKSFTNGKYKKYCSSFCSHFTKRNICLECGGLTFSEDCLCKNCKDDAGYSYNTFIERWKKGEETGISGKYGISRHIRQYMFDKYNGKCCKCGWGEINPKTNKSPLHIHHKDGNYKHNDEINLQLLCPNCHSITENYGSLNIGNGRNKNAVLV